MRLGTLLSAFCCLGLLSAISASDAQGFELLDRVLNINNARNVGGCGCAAPLPDYQAGCAAPAADCCAPAADCCAPRRCGLGLLHGLFSRHHADCCAPAPDCGCQAAPAPAPACGCDAAPACDCAPRRCGLGLLHGLFSRRHADCGCAPVASCGCGGDIAPVYVN